MDTDTFEEHGENEEEYYTRSLHDYWYPVAFSSELPKNHSYSISLFGIPLVLFRGADGSIICLEDRCSHRSTPLSFGAVENGNIECRYHGWRFGKDGVCNRVPSFEENKSIPDNFRVPYYLATEKDDMLWVWLGDPSKVDNLFLLPDPSDIAGLERVEQYWDTNYSADIMMENSLDPSHLQFVHEGQQGKGVGPRNNTYPGASGASTKVERIPGGYKGRIVDDNTIRKTDYEIYLYYPYYTVAMINSAKAQIRICTWVVPLSKNKSRLLFRFYRSFLKFLPASLFKKTNTIIARQDMVVLTGQQMRMEQGANGWNIHVKADALSLAYRRWWDKVVGQQKLWFRNWESTIKKPSVTLVCIEDIEDMGRAQVHPCVPNYIDLQEDYISKVKKELPDLWPQQYKKNRYTVYSLVVVSLVAIAAYFARGYFGL